MKNITRIMTNISDRLNPMLVRIIRQEVSSKVFIITFLLLLFISFAICSSWSLFAHYQDTEGSGLSLFYTLSAVLGFTLWVVQPIKAMKIISLEKDAKTWDLVQLTGMKSKDIAKGVTQTAIIQGLFYLSAIVPFMLMAYYLKGIDVIQIFATLVLGIMHGIFLSTLGAFLGNVGKTKAARSRSVVPFAVLLLLIFWISAAAISFGLPELLSESVGYIITAFIIIINIYVMFIWLFSSLTTTMLTIKTNNRSSTPKMIGLLIVLNAFLWWVILAVLKEFGLISHLSSRDIQTIFSIITVFSSIFMSFFCLFALTEEDTLSTRQIEWIQKPKKFRATTAWFLGSGKSRGKFYFLLVSISLIISSLTCYNFYHGSDVRFALAFSIISFTYAAIFFVITDFILKVMPKKIREKPFAHRIAMIFLTLIATILSLIISIAFKREDSLILYISPFYSIHQHDTHRYISSRDTADIITVILASFSYIYILITAIRTFKIKKRKTTALENDYNPRDE